MNRELIAIANEAIPLDPKCAINTKRAIQKRLWLVEKIEAYCAKQLTDQFNAVESVRRQSEGKLDEWNQFNAKEHEAIT